VPASAHPRSTALLLLLVGLLFQGLSGLWGGGALVADPTGDLLQMPLSLLDDSPFSDYFVPGLILLTALGVGPLIVALGLWRRRPWAWYGAVAVGGALVVWIGVEVWMIGYHTDPPLQLIYGTLGVLLLVLSTRPSVRRTLSADEPSRPGPG